MLMVAACMAVLYGAGRYQDHLPERFRIFIPPEELAPPALMRFIRSADHELRRFRAHFPFFHRSGKYEPRKPSVVPAFRRPPPKKKKVAESPVKRVRENRILDAGPDDAYLRSLHAKLARLQKGENLVVRILHYGESMIWADNVTGRTRDLLQRDFGDGGRGLVNILDTPPTRLSRHVNRTRGGFRKRLLPFVWFHFRPLPRLGFAAQSFRPRWSGAVTHHIAPGRVEAWKRARIILRDHRRRRAGGGRRSKYSLSLRARSDANAWTSHRATIPLKPGDCSATEIALPSAREIKLRFKWRNQAHIDGIALETGRGISYSTLVRMGVHMAWMSAIPMANRACGFKAYRPDLIIYQFGTNESASIDGFRHFTATRYEKQFRRFMKETRQAAPGVPILVFGPYERMKRKRRRLITVRSQLRVRDIQKRAARDLKLVYFDSYLALGGPGSMARMVGQGHALRDYMHITRSGGDILAAKFHGELMKSYRRAMKSTAAKAGVPKSGAPQAGELKKQARKGAKDPPTAGAKVSIARTGAAAVPPRPAKAPAHIAAAAEDSAGAIQFHSRAFAYFLGFVLIFGGALIRLPVLRLIFLILASYYFYATWKVWPLLLILASTLVDYCAGLCIDTARWFGSRGTIFLIGSLVVNLGLLFFFKYFDFLAGVINDAWAGDNSGIAPKLNLLLPVGISFYTFQTLSYTIDVWRRRMPAERNLLRFALYVSFFPQLVAGPIVRARDFLPDLLKSVRHFAIDRATIGAGTFLIACGLLKKTGADWIAAALVDRVYQDPSRYTSLEVIAAIYGYGLQIYGDFSGYTDIAIGAATLLGFRLTENFNRPYQSRSITEFWRRWHISLGSWFRDYVYIPLGGNRRFVYFNLFATMFLVGIWHGAGWNFIFWGVFHALLMMGERLLGLHRPVRGIMRVFRVLLTLHLVLGGWIIFRINDAGTAQAMWQTVMRGDFRLFNVEPVALVVVGAAYVWHLTPVALRDSLGHVWKIQWALPRGVAAAAIILLIYNLRAPSFQPYIYFQF